MPHRLFLSAILCFLPLSAYAADAPGSDPCAPAAPGLVGELVVMDIHAIHDKDGHRSLFSSARTVSLPGCPVPLNVTSEMSYLPSVPTAVIREGFSAMLSGERAGDGIVVSVKLDVSERSSVGDKPDTASLGRTIVLPAAEPEDGVKAILYGSPSRRGRFSVPFAGGSLEFHVSAKMIPSCPPGPTQSEPAWP